MRLRASQSTSISAVVPSTEKHLKQKAFVECPAKRIVVRAGRRGGKTYGMAIRAINKFLEGKRVLYAAPTQEQLDRFWVTVCRALQKPIDDGLLYKNSTRHLIELPGTERRIRAKTAWNADSLRGDYADELILDEWQLMNEDAWRLVGAPMLLDNNGNAIFIYTPPSLHTRSVSKADDPQHAAKLFKRASEDKTGRWAVFHFGSKDNPHVSAEAIQELAGDMTSLAYRMEIEAEDVDENPSALWSRATIDDNRVTDDEVPDLERIVVAVDPSATADGDEAGITVIGKGSNHGYLLADLSRQGSPAEWAKEAVRAFHYYGADRIVAEQNNGGEMVKLTILTVDPDVPVKLVHASRGKATRAEPVAAMYEHGRGHHVGCFSALEDEMCLWMPGDPSPNRMDALVWGFTELGLFRWQQASKTLKEKVIEALPEPLKPRAIKEEPDEEKRALLLIAQAMKTKEITNRLNKPHTRNAVTRLRQEMFKG